TRPTRHGLGTRHVDPAMDTRRLRQVRLRPGVRLLPWSAGTGPFGEQTQMTANEHDLSDELVDYNRQPLPIPRLGRGPTVSVKGSDASGSSKRNDLLRRARLCTPSPSDRTRPMSQRELAEAVTAYVFRKTE